MSAPPEGGTGAAGRSGNPGAEAGAGGQPGVRGGTGAGEAAGAAREAGGLAAGAPREAPESGGLASGAPQEAGAGGAAGETKADLRARLLAWRGSLAAAEVERGSAAVAGHVLSWPLWCGARTVLLYLATAREVQTAALIAAAVAAGKRVCVPGLDGVLRQLSDPAAVRRSARRVPEPDPDACPELSPESVELALLPGVAFDPSGRRLGRGAGFYDRLLPRLRCPTCGLAFDGQIVPRVPADPWDRPLDHLATERGLLDCRE